MSDYYAEQNSETAFELFNKRTVYVGEASNSNYTNLIDFYAEKMMYGRVSRRFVPIAIPEKSVNLKQLTQAVTPDTNMRALNFVVDAFNDLVRQFRKCAMAATIDTTDPYLTDLKVYKAYESAGAQYQTYNRPYVDALKEIMNEKSTKIENFDMFVDQLTEAVKHGGMRAPFTAPAYIKSRKAPISISGLAIEIADLDPANDHEKVEKFLKSNNWEFFLNACQTYGFMVDKNIPWRIVADIGSAPMIEYATRYRMLSTDDVLRRCYQAAPTQYYSSFSQRLLNMYNNIKPQFIIYSEECGGKPIFKKREPRKYSSLSHLQSFYDDSYFLKLYCRLRFYEEESQFTENQQNLIIDDVEELTRTKNVNVALGKFEIFLNKPFDYEGSLGYYINKQKEKETNST